MAKTVIRPRRRRTSPPLLRCIASLDSAMVALQPEFFCEAPREVDEIRKAVRGDDADFLLAEQDGTAVGFALVYYAGWTPAFSCVLPTVCLPGGSDRGRRCARAGHWQPAAGCGQALGRNRRLEYLELQVLAQNEGAQHLYESQDFVEATKVMRCML